MAEAVMESADSRGIWYKVRSFINANLVNIFAGGLFALLAIFLLFPIASVLIRSFGIESLDLYTFWPFRPDFVENLVKIYEEFQSEFLIYFHKIFNKVRSKRPKGIEI